MHTIAHRIGGHDVIGPHDGRGPIFNPATGEQERNVAFANAETVNLAVADSVRAAALWAKSSLSARTEVLFQFRALVASHAQQLAEVVANEHGKVVADGLGEVARGLENVEFACGLGEHLKGSFAHEVATGVDVSSLHAPLGVVVGITPFNFPVMVPLWMAANAIACGNAFLLKPSEKDPSAALLLADLWEQAGLPAGVFNVLHGDRTVVEQLVTHDDVAAISFVGSTPVAKHLYETGTRYGKRVQALGGAKNHMVVLADADLDVAADAAVSAAFGSSGERCMAISVVVCVEPVGDALVEAIVSRTQQLVVGPASDPAAQMGPLISLEHHAFVDNLVTDAAKSGATLAVDGRTCSVAGHEDGYFFGPTVVDGVTTTMGVYQREVFGPVLSVVRVATFDEAVALINANPYGNGTAIFTRDGGAARTFVNRVTVGMVGVNVPIPVPVASFSFGGWKDSLFGSHHMYGPDGFSFFTRTKVTTTRWPDPATSSVDLGFPRTR